jgi:hypothetical protein
MFGSQYSTYIPTGNTRKNRIPRNHPVKRNHPTKRVLEIKGGR